MRPLILREEPVTAASLHPVPDITILSEGMGKPPEFPLRYLHGWEEWIKAAADAQSAPVDYVAVAFLSAIATAIGNSRWAAAGSWKEPPVLWCALIGKPSSGKSPALDVILQSIDAIDREAFAGFKTARNQYEEQCERAKQAKESWRDGVRTATKNSAPVPAMPDAARDPEPPPLPRIKVQDSTQEALAKILSGNPRGVMSFRDELGAWLANMGRYSGGADGDRAFWLEAFGGRPFVIDRVKSGGEPIRIDRLSVNVLGGLQPDRLASLFLEGDDDGLTARFLYCWPQSRPPLLTGAEIDGDFLTTRLRWLRSLPFAQTVDGDAVPLLLQLSPEALAVMQDFRLVNYEEVQSTGGKLMGHYGKYPGLALRLALVLEYAWAALPDIKQEPRMISAQALASAVEMLGEYFSPMACRAFGDAALPDEDRNAATLAKALLRRAPRPSLLNERDVCRTWHLSGLGRQNKEAVTKACQVLADGGWLFKPESHPAAVGRKGLNWNVNPRIWEG